MDSLGSATVNLEIYFWLDGTQYSWLKVKSSVIRLVKQAIEEVGISMPDEAREIIFPQGVPVRTLEQVPAPADEKAEVEPVQGDRVSTDAEGGLRSEADEIETQARHARTPEAGENLLKDQ